MSNYAEQILDNQKDNDDAIIEIQDVIFHKYNKLSLFKRGIKALTESEKVIFLVGEVEKEVNNGGFSQFFLNSSGKYAKEAVASLNQIGANYTASLLQEAIDIYNDPNPPGTNGDEEDDLTDAQEENLNDLDNKFYEYEDNLTELQIAYIRRNLNDFK